MVKLPKYPLEQLIVIKQKKLEEAERVLVEKKRQVALELQKLAQVEKERDKVKDHRQAKLQQLRDKLDEGTTSDKIQLMKQYLKVVDEQLKQKEMKVKDQQKNVALAEKNLELARQDLFQKNQDLEKILLHRKEWEKEVRHKMAQDEAIETDELGSGMHARKKKRKDG